MGEEELSCAIDVSRKCPQKILRVTEYNSEKHSSLFFIGGEKKWNLSAPGAKNNCYREGKICSLSSTHICPQRSPDDCPLSTAPLVYPESKRGKTLGPAQCNCVQRVCGSCKHCVKCLCGMVKKTREGMKKNRRKRNECIFGYYFGYNVYPKEKRRSLWNSTVEESYSVFSVIKVELHYQK